jgi:hypothetical protein
VTDKTIETIKTSIRALLSDSISATVDASLPLDELRGVAGFNPIRDERFTSLSSFPAAAKIVTTIPNFTARFGTTIALVLSYSSSINIFAVLTQSN